MFNRAAPLALLFLFAMPAFAQGATLGDACSDAVQCVQGLRCSGGVCSAPLISYGAYKTVHIIAVLTLFLTLGGLVFMSLAKTEDKKLMRLAMILNGVAVLIVLVGGFGLMARLNVQHGAGWPGWLKVKMGLWLAVAFFVMVPKRLPAINRLAWPLVLVLGGLAVYMAVHKPF